ncbi:DUF4064 domain-containing protein [Listeria sp. FSL L7-0233]|uniref:DUF4064 domain-containing protein n=1 Tax=Listeria cossartiae TaxID=2838249 RepID=UPI00162A2A1C|nr:DUF4064 domain-containing protein [Listeria cossartiae]MBC2182992.1 DUF4064 domain-containing protein [Listeria cossartiae subsp. cossartiae]MBC2185378.1 DUF4064 domain-containing protein [Listeria cossartiae subsp. cossartiae]
MNRQTEFTLLIVGASFSIMTFLGAMAYTVIFGLNTLLVFDTSYYAGPDEAIFFGIITFVSVIAVIFALVSAIFGFVGAFKVKSGGPKVKTIAVCFIILGGLQVFTIHGILFLIAGILAVNKKEYKTISKEYETISTEDEGTKWE